MRAWQGWLCGMALTGCTNNTVVATLEVETEGGDPATLRVVDETFHLNGFASIQDDHGNTIQLQLAQGQSGPYQTGLDVVWGDSFSGNVTVDVDVRWTGNGRVPFTYDVSFVEGRVSAGSTLFLVTGGGFTIANQGCRSSGGIGASTDCGNGWAWSDDASAEVTFPLGSPVSSATLTAGLCPDDLVEQWLTETFVVMTSKRAELGARTLSCVTTQSEARVCGDHRTGLSADGCDDWRATWTAYPNATQQNAPFTLVLGAGADCDGAPRTCRSTWFASTYDDGANGR